MQQRDQWPPEPWAQAIRGSRESAIWWEGTVDKLAAQYGVSASWGRQENQPREGWLNRLMRLFWSKPSTPGNRERKIHIPIPADLAQLSAAAMFSDAPTFTSEDPVTQGMCDLLLNTATMHSWIIAAAESAAALRGVAGRVVWDTDASPDPWIEWVDADACLPEFGPGGKLTAITFWTRLPQHNGGKVIRHLQRYIPGGIQHTLWEGSDDTKGRNIPLTDHPSTEGLAELVDEDATVRTGGTLLPAVWIPNSTTNIEFRHDATLKHMGKADISPDLFPLFDAVDEAWSGLMDDIRRGRARIIVAKSLLEDNGRGRGAEFDTDRTVFSPLNHPPDPNGTPLVEFVQPQIRVEQHLSAAEGLIREIIRKAGYSPLSFGLEDTGGEMTAEETKARTQKTIDTVKAKGRHWQAGLTLLGTALLEVAHGLAGRVPPVLSVTVLMPDVVPVPFKDLASSVQMLDSARAISTVEKVRRLNPGQDDTWVKHEAELIRSEQGIGVDVFGEPDRAFGVGDGGS